MEVVGGLTCLDLIINQIEVIFLPVLCFFRNQAFDFVLGSSIRELQTVVV